MTVDITVTGMSCASCVAHVEQAVSAVKGVDSCSVNLLTGLLRAEGENISRNDVIAAVKDAGYGISSGREAADRSLLKLITSLITAAVVMALQMSGILNRLFTGIICLVLSLFVIVINFSYFKRGFRALININPNMDTLIFIGSSCSFIYSAALLILTSGGGNMYFDSASMILAFVSMGKYLESRAKKKGKQRGQGTLQPYSRDLRTGDRKRYGSGRGKKCSHGRYGNYKTR